MIRNLKVLLAAALALTALGAIAASAHAADEFHCSVEPCRFRLHQDGTLKTSHHVFILENSTTTESLSFTCNELAGDGTSATKTAKEVRLTGLVYNGCTVNGSGVVNVDMNGCEYLFKAAGGTTDEAEVNVECPTGKKIEITIPALGCTFSIAPVNGLKGIGYHTEGVAPNRELTATVNHVTIPSATVSTNGCGSLITSTVLTGTYTTGNTLITGESEPSEAMAETWYE